MTTKDVMKMYSIEMKNRVMTPQGPGNKYIKKTFTGGGEMETYFDLVNCIPEYLTDDIIPIVQHFIDGNVPAMDPELAELGGMTTFAIPNLNGIYFHNLSNGEIKQIVPLEHFKIIAEAWRDFLLQPPLSSNPFSGI